MPQINNLARHARLLEIVGDTDKGRAFGGMPIVENTDGDSSLAKVVDAGRHLATLRVFLSRIALLIFAMHAVGCGDKDKEKAQTPPVTSAPQPSQPEPVPKLEATTLTSLESLVAPIALYPDPLLAEVLVAATYPLEVVQAARWLESKPDPATVRGKNWDASVVRLTAVPDVIAMMDQHLDWTTQLGDAFLSNPPQLLDAIQTLRKRAIDAGFLKDSDLQKVEAETVSMQEPEQELTEGVKATPAVLTEEVISIKPAKADTLAVPKYNPEVVYAASMAPPPTTQMYPAGTMTAAPAASYYPTYYAQPVTTTTTTSSSSDQWMSFGTGAVVGGLLTWGIMEWADDDDWDDYHVSHHYGNAVCHGGNCWHGGGGGYYGGSANVSRGDVNVDREVNISGNEINVSRDGTFSANQLSALKGQTSRWQPNPSHRRGQDYPLAAQQRMGRTESPALAGSRLSGAQNIPADTRGFGKVEAADRSAQARPSSADVQRSLAAKTGTAESRSRPVPGSRESALEGLQASGQRSNVESRRGASSQGSRQQQAGRARTKDLGASTNAAAQSQRRAEPARQRSGNQQQKARQRNEQTQQGLQSQRRQEMSRPNAFESTRDGGRSSAFSNRGSASVSRAQQPARQSPSSGGQREVSRGAGGAARSRGGRR